MYKFIYNANILNKDQWAEHFYSKFGLQHKKLFLTNTIGCYNFSTTSDFC